VVAGAGGHSVPPHHWSTSAARASPSRAIGTAPRPNATRHRWAPEASCHLSDRAREMIRAWRRPTSATPGSRIYAGQAHSPVACSAAVSQVQDRARRGRRCRRWPTPPFVDGRSDVDHGIRRAQWGWSRSRDYRDFVRALPAPAGVNDRLRPGHDQLTLVRSPADRAAPNRRPVRPL
jgi:hypothetical protein